MSFGKRGTPSALTPVRALAQGAKRADTAPAGRPNWPLATAALTTILIVIFWFEEVFRLEPPTGTSFGLRDLVAFGGVGSYLVFHQGELWRLWTAPWLHASFSHLLSNGVTLVVAGCNLEHLIGRSWLVAIFVLGALGGVIGSLTLSQSMVVGVGASGAIMCLVAVLFALSFHYEASAPATRLRRTALFVLVTALLPSAADSAVQVDIGAHTGGAMMGLVLGFLLLSLWPETQSMPPQSRLVTYVAGTGLVAAAVSFLAIAATYNAHAAQTASLVPFADWPKSASDYSLRGANLAAKYPRDPAIHWVKAMDLFDRKDYPGAEAQLRAGLDEQDMLATQFGPAVEQDMRMLLAQTLLRQRRVDEAKTTADALCAVKRRDKAWKRDIATLKSAQICTG